MDSQNSLSQSQKGNQKSISSVSNSFLADDENRISSNYVLKATKGSKSMAVSADKAMLQAECDSGRDLRIKDILPSTSKDRNSVQRSSSFSKPKNVKKESINRSSSPVSRISTQSSSSLSRVSFPELPAFFSKSSSRSFVESKRTDGDTQSNLNRSISVLGDNSVVVSSTSIIHEDVVKRSDKSRRGKVVRKPITMTLDKSFPNLHDA